MQAPIDERIERECGHDIQVPLVRALAGTLLAAWELLTRSVVVHAAAVSLRGVCVQIPFKARPPVA